MPTIVRTAVGAAKTKTSTRAERLVQAIHAMPIEDVRARMRRTAVMSGGDVEQLQRDERRQRAEAAAAALRG